jgi:3-isopropylmalate/(R)-2-methylmalate dehydratase small subunit
MILKGKALKFSINDDISTDYIISGRYKFALADPNMLAQHCMEDLDPDFHKKSAGNFIVAGENFGCGSSREEASVAIKYAGINGVIAKSFDGIFRRNSINIGLPLAECNTDEIESGDALKLCLEKGILWHRSREIVVRQLPEVMMSILRDGGLIPHFKRHGGFFIAQRGL